MIRDLISRRTCIDFREVLVDFRLREIDDLFDGAGLQPDLEHDPSMSGQRRCRVEQYYVNIDLTSYGDVEKLLGVYCEIISHLEREHADLLLRQLEQDGFAFDADGKFKQLPGKHNPLLGALDDLAKSLAYPQLANHVELMVSTVEDNPPLAVGSAKETIETVCKTILAERGVDPIPRDLGKLVRSTARELRLLPESISDRAKGIKTIRRLLSNLAQIADGLAELRNLYGSGHGREGRSTSVSPRHARLAVGAAATLATFFLETHCDSQSHEAS